MFSEHESESQVNICKVLKEQFENSGDVKAPSKGYVEGNLEK